MTRRKHRDEPLPLDVSAAERGKRVYLRELAAYMQHHIVELRRFAQDMGILYWQGMGGGRESVPYVSEAGAMRLIAYARAIEGAEYVAGKAYHERRQRFAAYIKRRQAHLRGILKQKEEAEAGRRALLLAIPPAGTEDESRGGT